MVEIVRWIVGHPKAFHYSPRSLVLWNRERNDFLQRERSESERNRCASSLRRVATSPILHGKTPTHLDTRREVRLKSRNGETHKSDERAPRTHLDGPQAETMLLEVSFDALDHRIALRARQNIREMLHHANVRVERRERASVGLSPPP